MRISIIGTGYVGLVSGACLAELGHSVTCMDINSEKIRLLKQCEIPIFEPGLKELVVRNMSLNRLFFNSDYEETIQTANVIFITVDTPSDNYGGCNLQQLNVLIDIIANYINCDKVIINKSTVPVGTGKQIEAIINQKIKGIGKPYKVDVVSNPEFLREGTAVYDFMNPERIVIGTETEAAKKVMEQIYINFINSTIPYIFTNTTTAEIIKYASNVFLAMKIGFINEISNICEVVGGDISDVSYGMGLDSRINPSFLKVGPGYGGSCLPKDTKALYTLVRTLALDTPIIESIDESNIKQKHKSVDKIKRIMNGVADKNIAVLGLAFKSGTDDVRESPAVFIVQQLLNSNATIKLFDPIAMENAKKLLPRTPNLSYGKDEYDTIKDADAILITTEWEQFKNLDFNHIATQVRSKLIIDFKNLLKEKNLSEYTYVGIGRGI